MTESEDKLTHSLFMTLREKVSTNKVLKAFTKSGWAWRNCSWDEYEVTLKDLAELVMTSTNPVLISDLPKASLRSTRLNPS